MSAELQARSLTANEAQEIASMTIKTLQGIRNDQCFQLFYERVTKEAKIKDVAEPVLPRKRKTPARIEECLGGRAVPEFPSSPQERYKAIYFEALDLIIHTSKTVSISKITKFTPPVNPCY